jgi:hypothetical protein
MKCYVCGKIKTREGFNQYNKVTCRVCIMVRKRQWNKNHPERLKEYKEKRLKGKRYRKTIDGWMRLNPEKRRAHHIVDKAIMRGKIKRPETCQKCGLVLKLHAHHNDYSKPLKVYWVCPSCHRIIHFQENKHYGTMF